MQTELIQLLKNEDANNIKLGCILARAAGYSDVEIVDNILDYNEDNKRYSAYIKDYNYSLMIESKTECYKRFNKVLYIFVIYDFNSDYNKNDRDDKNISQKHYNRIKASFSKHFIDMIINR